MSQSARKRLAQVNGSLTPRQAIAQWLEAGETAHRLESYVQSLCTESASSAPLVQLTRQVVEGTRAAMPTRKREDLQRVVRQQMVEISFLYLLHEKVNDRVLERHPTVWLRMELLSEMLYPLLDGGLPRAGLIPAWRQRAQVQALVVLGTERAVQVLSQRHFGGRLPLFEEVAEDLQQQVATTKELIALFNDARSLYAPLTSRRRKRGHSLEVDPPVDLVALEPSIQRYAEGEVTRLVAMAKAGALLQVGDREGARDCLRPHLLGAEG